MSQLEIVDLRACSTTVFIAGQVCQQWAKTPAGCQPSGEGWQAPIVGDTDEEWVWRRDYDPVNKIPVIRDLERDTQPIYVDNIAPGIVITNL
jgi:hypothetical protein